MSNNIEQFIAEAVRSALLQTYYPLEIIISDDCSIDGTFNIIQREISKYHGRAAIILNRNERNLGVTGNLNKAVELSHGRFIVMVHGDDIACSDRVEKLINCWKKTDPPIDLVCSYYSEIDSEGVPTGYSGLDLFTPDVSKSALKWKCAATGATAFYSRNLFEKYGRLNTITYAEDWVLPFRAWLESGIAVVKEPLVKLRQHNNSYSFLMKKNNLRFERNIEIKKDKKYKSVVSELGIAQEWLHAWKIGGKNKVVGDKKYFRIYSQLQQLVKLRKMQVDMFDSGRIKALILIIKYFVHGGQFSKAVKNIIRFVINWN